VKIKVIVDLVLMEENDHEQKRDECDTAIMIFYIIYFR